MDGLAISPQCGFASVMVGNESTKMAQRRKLELVGRVASTDLGLDGAGGETAGDVHLFAHRLTESVGERLHVRTALRVALREDR